MHDHNVIWSLLSSEPPASEMTYTVSGGALNSAHSPSEPPTKHLHYWQHDSIFISLNAVVFESHNLPSSKYWHKT